MNKLLRNHADIIISQSITAVKPDNAVKRALESKVFPGKVILLAVGKAAWSMAKTASDCLQNKITAGIIITKYGHIQGEISDFRCYEAGHPLPDENSVKATAEALKLTDNLTENDTVLFLLSGGGSSLFEKPLIPLEELQDITEQLLACGADITEINTLRKRFSQVKGGKFAQWCKPAQIYSIVLSDIIGDPLDMIASGPAYPDSTTATDAIDIVKKYQLKLSDTAKELLSVETPKILDNVITKITGSVKELCKAVTVTCKNLGYEPVLLTDQLCCEAREAGSFLASILKTHSNDNKNLAFIAGGETVVHLTGVGKGGRNQEIALSAAAKIEGEKTMAVFSVGSDGTDGPTDAAGGYCDGDTAKELCSAGIKIHEVLKQNDAYTALKLTDGLIFTGPTGTNVNDVAVALLHNT